MIRWQYKLVSIGGSAPTSPGLRLLEEAGKDGWEAVAVEHGHVLCKRPAIAPADPAYFESMVDTEANRMGTDRGGERYSRGHNGGDAR